MISCATLEHCTNNAVGVSSAFVCELTESPSGKRGRGVLFPRRVGRRRHFDHAERADKQLRPNRFDFGVHNDTAKCVLFFPHVGSKNLDALRHRGVVAGEQMLLRDWGGQAHTGAIGSDAHKIADMFVSLAVCPQNLRL